MPCACDDLFGRASGPLQDERNVLCAELGVLRGDAVVILFLCLLPTIYVYAYPFLSSFLPDKYNREGANPPTPVH